MFKLFAKKSLGQNFLINQGIVQKIIDAAELSKEDVVLEVGPGTGILTRELEKLAGKVIAVEKDRRAIDQLRQDLPNVEIIEKDVLEFTPELDSYKIVANLPYYITSHFLRIALEDWPAPKLMILMVQKEVAQRIMAQPPDMNLLALSVQMYAKPEIISHVSRGSFRPMPNVDSSVIKLVPHANKPTLNILPLIKAGFAAKRKMLVNNLSTIYPKEAIIEALMALGLNEQIRAENLSLTQWESLAKLLLAPS
ncbi:16S rRNA (adenine(1518)-N(6)/adenine(1519)-N(6))-dimethyltransferase RsmA [Candidatus Parcubacteria bacterium]|nr:16S rRNA (adenine(1518)-N(6)/adenine(1519)-N(6))-dimethyltransferase RsmA [Candidatus Parcubacteria bacterium]